MRVKKITLKDTLTRIPVVVLQFEQTDEAFCKAAGFGTGLKVILKFAGRLVSCMAGYEFKGEYTIADDLITEFDPEATIISFGAVVDQAENVLHLPDEINVEETRLALYEMDREPFLHRVFEETLDQYTDHSVLRKAIYMNWYGSAQIILIDTADNQVVLQFGGGDPESDIARYLWLDIQQATQEEIAPFITVLEFKSYILPESPVTD